VDQLARVVAVVGFPVVVAGILLWYVLGKFQADMTLIAGRMEANAQAAVRLVASEAAVLEESKRQTAALEEIARTVRQREREPVK